MMMPGGFGSIPIWPLCVLRYHATACTWYGPVNTLQRVIASRPPALAMVSGSVS